MYTIYIYMDMYIHIYTYWIYMAWLKVGIPTKLKQHAKVLKVCWSLEYDEKTMMNPCLILDTWYQKNKLYNKELIPDSSCSSSYSVASSQTTPQKTTGKSESQRTTCWSWHVSHPTNHKTPGWHCQCKPSWHAQKIPLIFLGKPSPQKKQWQAAW